MIKQTGPWIWRMTSVEPSIQLIFICDIKRLSVSLSIYPAPRPNPPTLRLKTSHASRHARLALGLWLGS